MRRAVALGLLAWAGTAAADPLDDFGFGGRAAATAGARAATAVGPEAAHHNPAGVALAPYPAVMLGWGHGSMLLEVDGRDAEVLDPHGTTIGLAIPIRLTDTWVIAAGTALYLPDQFLARVQLIPSTEPHFVLLDNDPHRASVELVGSAAYGDKLAFGAGASVFANARSRKLTFDVGIVAGEKVGEAELDVELPVRLAPLLGLWLRPHPRVRAGLVYRGELALDLDLDILANVEVAGVVTGDALVSIRASNYFTPTRLGGGLALDVLTDLTLEADVTWNRWSTYPPAADLAVLVALDITPPLVQTDLPLPAFEDTVTSRIGVEYRRPGRRTDLAIRAGGAWMPSPVPAQTGLTSYADGDRLLLSAGAGLRLADWAPILTRPIDLDLAVQWQSVEQQLTRKDTAMFPGQAFSSGGSIVHAGGSATVSF